MPLEDSSKPSASPGDHPSHLSDFKASPGGDPRATLLVVDIQARFAASIHAWDRVVTNGTILCRAAGALGLLAALICAPATVGLLRGSLARPRTVAG